MRRPLPIHFKVTLENVEGTPEWIKGALKIHQYGIWSWGD